MHTVLHVQEKEGQRNEKGGREEEEGRRKKEKSRVRREIKEMDNMNEYIISFPDLFLQYIHHFQYNIL